MNQIDPFASRSAMLRAWKATSCSASPGRLALFLLLQGVTEPSGSVFVERTQPLLVLAQLSLCHRAFGPGLRSKPGTVSLR